MSFERTVILPVDPDTAFTLVTDPERLRRWQTVACRMNLRVSGSYRLTMGPGHHAAGTVTEIEPGRRQVLSWGWECSDAVLPGDSTLYITMEPHAEGTALTLRHERLDAGQSSGHAEGRNHFLDRLVRFAKAGHADPDEWNATPEPADAITAAEASLAALQLVLHHLQEKDMQRPTPCTEFNVSQLVDHLAGNLALACKALGSEQADDPSLEPEPRIAQLAQAALESFSARGLEGTLDLGFAVVPASVLSGILNLEFMVHGRDFAQATSQDFDVDPGLAEYVLELARATVGEQQRASGSFGPETAIAESAGSLERLIAFTGRVPAGA